MNKISQLSNFYIRVRQLMTEYFRGLFIHFIERKQFILCLIILLSTTSQNTYKNIPTPFHFLNQQLSIAKLTNTNQFQSFYYYFPQSFFPLSNSQFYQYSQIKNILFIVLRMEPEPITLSDDFKKILIFQQQSLHDYVIPPSIIQHKFKLKPVKNIIQTPIVKEFLLKITTIKDVLEQFQMTLNNNQRTIYKPRQANNKTAQIKNQFIVDHFAQILNTYKLEILPKTQTLPIFLTIHRNFQQQIKQGNRIIYEEEKQRAIIWDQEVKGQQKSISVEAEQKQLEKSLHRSAKNDIRQSGNKMNIKKESLKAITGTYHKIVKINLDKKYLKFGQFDKIITQFQGIKAQIKGEEIIISIGRWKGEEPIEIITINYVPEQQTFINYKKYEMKNIAKSTVWFSQNGIIKCYHQRQ